MAEGKQDSGWKFTGSKQEGQPANQNITPEIGSVAWTASEYIEHDKSTNWFVLFGLATVGGLAVVFLFTRDWISVVLLVVLAITFGIFAARKPHVLQYQLDSQGITIGQKFYPIDLFRSFAVIDEGAFRSVTLLPMKRFMPAISVYYAPTDEQAILETLGNLLPQEIRQQDTLDKFMRRIRF